MRVVNGFHPLGDNDLVTSWAQYYASSGKARELEEGSIPPDFLLELISCGGGRYPQMLDLCDIGKVGENLSVEGGAQDCVVRTASIDPRLG
jgi:hypothetical protein